MNRPWTELRKEWELPLLDPVRMLLFIRSLGVLIIFYLLSCRAPGARESSAQNCLTACIPLELMKLGPTTVCGRVRVAGFTKTEFLPTAVLLARPALSLAHP